MTGRSLVETLRDTFLVGKSTEMACVVEAIEDVAALDVPVLIEGERGTGRELVARAIHYASARQAGDFVALNAATVPRPRLDDELYGAKAGKLRRAQGGTLLLKDVAALPRGPQKQLARVLGKRGRDADAYDVRVIGAAEGTLRPAVDADAFDRELYEQLGARKIAIPPLRRRLADLPRLALHFAEQVVTETSRARVSLSARATDRLLQYSWPGNVAELKNVMRRLVLSTSRKLLQASDIDTVLPEVAERIPLEDMAFEEIVRAKLRGFLKQTGAYPVDNLYGEVIARVERPLLALVMEHTGQNQLRAAEILGLNRNTLRKKLATLGLLD
jgi:two-component system nitrogen regulation response regulator GlnG